MKPATSHHTCLHALRAPVIAMVCAMACSMMLPAKQKKTDWDARAATAKADYYYLEAERQRSLGNNDAFYHLLSKAAELNPADNLIKFDYAFYNILGNANDSAIVYSNYEKMGDYFLEHPEDIYNASTYARVSGRLGYVRNAMEVWRRLHDIYPDNDALTLRRAESLFASPDSAERAHGMALYDSIEAAQGKDLQITNTKIARYLDDSDTTAAIRELDDLLRAFPRNAQIIAYAGDVHLALDDPNSALLYYRRACEADSTNGYPFYALANFYNSQGDSVAYNREIINALRKKSLDLDTKLQIFKSYIETSLRTAQEAADSIIDPGIVEADPATVTLEEYGDEPALDPAFMEAQRAKVDEIFKILQEEYTLEPDLYNFYASYLITIEDYNGAAEMLSQSLNIEPAHESRWVSLISLDMQLNEAQDVIADASRAMRYFPGNNAFPMMMSLALIQEERYDEALEQLDKAEELVDSTDLKTRAQIKASRADIFYATNRRDEAMAQYGEAVKLDPDNALALNNMAYYLAVRDEDLERALDLIRRADTLRPDEPTQLDTYAWVLFKLKRYSEALEKIERALELSPGTDNAEIYDHAGDILFMNGRRDQALDFWKKALKEDPDNDLLRRKVKHRTIFFE